VAPDRIGLSLCLTLALAACGGGATPPATVAATDSAAAPAPKVDARAAAADSAEAARVAGAHKDSASVTGPLAQRETFAYAGGSRDPFASLLDMATSGPELPDLMLVAIYQDLAYNSNSVALLRDRTNDRRFKLRVGDQLGRLKVAQIRQKDVVFIVEDFGFERQETLSLSKREEQTQ
jgi:hypothetical protein